jgi:hypothetical protein
MKNLIGPLADKAITLYTLSIGCVVFALIVFILKLNLYDNSIGFFLFPLSLGIIIVGFMLAIIGAGLGIIGAQSNENYAMLVVAGGFVLILIYGGLAFFFLYYLQMM